MATRNSARTRCKAGDRAIVIKAHHPENVGRLVLVLRRAKQSEMCLDPSDEAGAWVVRSLGSPLVTEDEAGDTWLSQERPFCDARLCPIRGDTDRQIQHRERPAPSAICGTSSAIIKTEA